MFLSNLDSTHNVYKSKLLKYCCFYGYFIPQDDKLALRHTKLNVSELVVIPGALDPDAVALI